MRDLRRHLKDIPARGLRDRITAKLALVSQQRKQAKNIYTLHEPEVDCISKGKARVPYESGCKVNVATMLGEGFVVGIRSFQGNPYDGHTLREALGQVEILIDQRPELAVIGRGYRVGNDEGKTRVLISGTRRGLPA
jgi:transposase, IS5 family